MVRGAGMPLIVGIECKMGAPGKGMGGSEAVKARGFGARGGSGSIVTEVGFHFRMIAAGQFGEGSGSGVAKGWQRHTERNSLP